MKQTLLLGALCASCVAHPPKKIESQPPTKAEPCASSVLRFDPQQWKTQLQNANRQPEGEPRTTALKSLLQEVGVEPDEIEWSPTDNCSMLQIGEVRISSTKMAQQPVTILEIDLESCNPAILVNTPSTYVRLLRSVEDGLCPIDNELSSQSLGAACLSPKQFEAQESAVVVTPVHLLSADSFDLQVVNEDGRCDSYTEREGHFTTSFWTLRNGKLEKLFEASTFDTVYRSPTPPQQWTEGTLSFEGAFPKQIRFQEKVVCDPLGAEENKENSCKPSNKESLFRFDGKQYLSQ
jgi:hypothetical protein